MVVRRSIRLYFQARITAAFVFEFTSSTEREKSKGPNSPQRLSVLIGTAATRWQIVSCTERKGATHSHGIEVASITTCRRRAVWATVAATYVHLVTRWVATSSWQEALPRSRWSVAWNTASLEHEVQRLAICHAAQCDALDGVRVGNRLPRVVYKYWARQALLWSHACP